MLSCELGFLNCMRTGKRRRITSTGQAGPVEHPVNQHADQRTDWGSNLALVVWFIKKYVLCLVHARPEQCITVRLEALLAWKPTLAVDVSSSGPRHALRRVCDLIPQTAEGRRAWMANARMTAVMGSCPRSKDSFNAGRWPLASYVLV